MERFIRWLARRFMADKEIFILPSTVSHSEAWALFGKFFPGYHIAKNPPKGVKRPRKENVTEDSQNGRGQTD